MARYLKCLKKHGGENDDECRMISKGYLQCRMDQYVLCIFPLDTCQRLYWVD
jgi:cytochrome c oxidase assembly protein subunit 19